MPAIPVNKVVDPKRLIRKNGGPRRRRRESNGVTDPPPKKKRKKRNAIHIYSTLLYTGTPINTS
jgi:hypothetical protein